MVSSSARRTCMLQWRAFWMVLPIFLSFARGANVDVQSTSTEVALGSLVRFSASTDSPDPSNIVYKFRARRVGTEFVTIRDSGPNNNLDWTTIDRDGPYDIEVTA